MATSAYQIAFSQEIINGFDKTVSVLRDTVYTEAIIKGGSATFLVADTVNQVARTRGNNGLIPADPLALTQNTATLVPWYKFVPVADFNIFASQGDLNKPMQAAVMASINRKIDDDIITMLNTASQTTGAAQKASMSLIAKAKVTLGVNKVPNNGELTLLATPAFVSGNLMQLPEFTSADYVSARPLADGGPAFGDKRMVYKWNGMTVIEDPTLPGVGTASESCFLYHKMAIGHAMAAKDIVTNIGFNEEQMYSWANCRSFMGSVLLQNSGVVKIVHDGTMA